MKAKMSYDGVITVSAEDELEGYALNKWADEHFDKTKQTIDIGKFIIQPVAKKDSKIGFNK